MKEYISKFFFSHFTFVWFLVLKLVQNQEQSSPVYWEIKSSQKQKSLGSLVSYSSLFSMLYINCWIDLKNHEPVFIPRELLAFKRYTQDMSFSTGHMMHWLQQYLMLRCHLLSVTEFSLASNKPGYNISMCYNLH